MKKLFLIPAILLIASFFITCDLAEGDWTKIPNPRVLNILDDTEITLALSAVGDEDHYTFSESIPVVNPMTGKTFNKLIVVLDDEGVDYGWWAGGKVLGTGAGLDWEDLEIEGTFTYTLKGWTSINGFAFKGGFTQGTFPVAKIKSVILTQ